MLHFIIVMQICQMLENSINIWQIDILWRRVNTHWGTNKALLHAIYQLPFTQTGLAGQTAHSTAGSKEQLGMNQCQTVLYFGWRRMTKVKFYAHRANQHLSLCVGLLLSPLLKARFYTTLNKCCFVINETELYNISLPSSKATLLADVQVGAHQNLQALFCRTAFQLGVLHVFGCLGLSLPRCWTAVLVELQEVPACLPLQHVKVSHDVCTALWWTNHSSQFCVMSGFTEGALYSTPFIQLINEDAEQDWIQYRPVGYFAHYWRRLFCATV